jgi:site-specific recombinase XerD
MEEQPQIERRLKDFDLSLPADGISENTIPNYRHALKRLANCQACEDRSDPRQLGPGDLTAFFSSLRTLANGRGEFLSRKTIRNAWVALRSFYRWMA